MIKTPPLVRSYCTSGECMNMGLTGQLECIHGIEVPDEVWDDVRGADQLPELRSDGRPNTHYDLMLLLSRAAEAGLADKVPIALRHVSTGGDKLPPRPRGPLQ